MNTADVAAPMRPEATYFEASPLVVRAHAPATIAIRPLYDHVRFNDGPYQVRVIPAEGAGAAAGAAGGRPQSLLPAGDELRVTHEFGGEQEYVVLVQPEHGEGKPAVEFRVYALEEDLFGRYPYKGDLHLHSSYSDGREPPGYVAACCRRTGLDFMALTDHRQYAPSLEAERVYAGLGCDLRMYPGEEVHPPDNPVHMVSFGGSASVNEQFATEAYRAGVAAVGQTLVDLPPGMDPYPYASCVWCFDRIRQGGGLGIFCHPYWFCAHRYDVPEHLTTLLLERQPFDALELIGGYHRHESESNVLQVARYHEERSRGRHLPIVGASDAHGCETGELFGWYYTVVFAPSVELADLIQGIKDLFSVAVEALPGETARAFGPFRLVKYSHFLLREVFPRHDALCREEGRLMLAHLAAEDGAAAGLRALGGRTEAMRQRLWDRA